jgi:AraC-like DNA-binding protein
MPKQGVIPLIDSFEGDLYLRHERFTAAEWQAHAHPWGQFNFVSRGVMHVEIDGERFLSPPQHAIWVPPFADHFSYVLGDTVYRSAYISLARSAAMPARACTVNVSAVLRAILDDFAARDVCTPETVADVRMAQVALDQILDAEQGTTYLPFGASAELNQILGELHRAPGDQRTTVELAAGLHMTARTLERRCTKELGMPLNEWRQRLMLLHAIEALDGGAQVQHIAYTLGYATTSAFIVMFKRMTGTTPEQYRLSRGA